MERADRLQGNGGVGITVMPVTGLGASSRLHPVATGFPVMSSPRPLHPGAPPQCGRNAVPRLGQWLPQAREQAGRRAVVGWSRVLQGECCLGALGAEGRLGREGNLVFMKFLPKPPSRQLVHSRRCWKL